MPPPGSPALTQPGSSFADPAGLGGAVPAAVLFSLLLTTTASKPLRSKITLSACSSSCAAAGGVTLFTFFKPENLHTQGLRRSVCPGRSGDQRRRDYLCLSGPDADYFRRQRGSAHPQRTIPVALILSVVLSTIIYVLLRHWRFLGIIPTEMLSGGWAEVK